MSLLTHIDTVPWGESVRMELMSGHMPPWRVDTIAPGGPTNGPYLTTIANPIFLAPEGPGEPLPLDAAVSHLPRLELDADEAVAASHGRPLGPAGLTGPYAVFGPDDRLIGDGGFGFGFAAEIEIE